MKGEESRSTMFEMAQRCGLRFECTQCSFCCTGSPGYVWLSDADIDALCAFLGMDFQEFAKTFCGYVEVEGGFALSLREKAHYDCIFLEAGNCSVYTARPIQCRSYPFWEEILDSEKNWKEEAAYCPGIGKGDFVPPQRIAEAVLARRSNPRRLFLSAGEDEQK